MTYEKAKKMSNENLNKIAQSIWEGKYGYNAVTSEFKNFENEGKIRWTRGMGWIQFLLSDWYTDCPEEYIEKMFDGLYHQIIEGDSQSASLLVHPIQQWSIDKRVAILGPEGYDAYMNKHKCSEEED